MADFALIIEGSYINIMNMCQLLTGLSLLPLYKLLLSRHGGEHTDKDKGLEFHGGKPAEREDNLAAVCVHTKHK